MTTTLFWTSNSDTMLLSDHHFPSSLLTSLCECIHSANSVSSFSSCLPLFTLSILNIHTCSTEFAGKHMYKCHDSLAISNLEWTSMSFCNLLIYLQSGSAPSYKSASSNLYCWGPSGGTTEERPLEVTFSIKISENTGNIHPNQLPELWKVAKGKQQTTGVHIFNKNGPGYEQ